MLTPNEKRNDVPKPIFSSTMLLLVSMFSYTKPYFNCNDGDRRCLQRALSRSVPCQVGSSWTGIVVEQAQDFLLFDSCCIHIYIGSIYIMQTTSERTFTTKCKMVLMCLSAPVKPAENLLLQSGLARRDPSRSAPASRLVSSTLRRKHAGPLANQRVSTRRKMYVTSNVLIWRGTCMRHAYRCGRRRTPLLSEEPARVVTRALLKS